MRVNDPVLEGYLQGVTCRLAREYCSQIRVYVMDVPHFNASMSPNGYMEIWTGLLLRVENEGFLGQHRSVDVGSGRDVDVLVTDGGSLEPGPFTDPHPLV